MIKLYGVGPARSVRVAWVLKELDVAHEFVSVKLSEGEHMKPEFLRLNPAHKIPVLVDGDQVITESAAIVLYLAEKYPGKGLIPADINARAQMYRWLMFAATELEQPLWRIARHTFLYPEDKRLPADIALAQGDFRDMAKVFEQHMSGHQYVVGDSFTVADCVTAWTIDWAYEMKLLDGLRNLQSYLERAYARPSAPLRMAAARAAMQA